MVYLFCPSTTKAPVCLYFFVFFDGLSDVLLELKERELRKQQVQEPVQPGTHRPPPFLVTLSTGSR